MLQQVIFQAGPTRFDRSRMSSFGANNRRRVFQSTATGTLPSAVTNTLAKCHNLAKVFALLDIFAWDPLNTYITVRTLKKQKISTEERRAIVTKRLIDMLWSDIYWVLIVLVSSIMKRALNRYGTALFGESKEKEHALKGLSNIVSAIIGGVFNEVLKPVYSNIMTVEMLNHLRKVPFEESPLRFIYQLFGYKEDNASPKTFSGGSRKSNGFRYL